VPRLVARARAGRLRIVGTGRNRVDMVHIANAVDAHLLAERALGGKSQTPNPKSQESQPGNRCHLIDDKGTAAPSAGSCNVIRDKTDPAQPADGQAYFITNGEPVVLWDWINDLLRALEIPPVTRHLPLGAAVAIGGVCEVLWSLLPFRGEPPMTRFVAKELATDHWFDLTAARRDLGYAPRVSMAEGTAELIASLRRTSAGSSP